MLACDEDALICDMAEYYNINEMRELPARRLATLAFGLPPDSRIKMAISGLEVSPRILLLSLIADHLGTLVWMQTEDGAKGVNRPASIVQALCGARAQEEKESNVQTYSSGKDFETAWRTLTGG